MTRSRSVLLIVVVLVLAAGGYGLWRWPTALFGPPADPGRISVSGNIEAHQSVLSFTQIQAPIVELPFDEGAHVARDTVLARADDRPYQQQVEIDRANQQVASAQVTVTESSLVAAQSSVASDEFDLTEKQLDYARAQELVKTAATSAQARDLAKTAAQQSEQTLAHDRAMVQVANANLVLARANAASVAAKQKLDEVTLGYTTLRAPFDGVISVREAELGQLAGPGVAIFTLDDLDHIWLRAYVNEQDLGKIRLAEPADVTTDTYPGKIYHGHISFISPEAEFTPKTVETHAERVTLVYRVRIDIDNPTHELLPGMPADASIAALPPGP
jgi:HlyD family secretion protein